MDYPSKAKKENSKNTNKKFITKYICCDYKLVITHEQEKLQKI